LNSRVKRSSVIVTLTMVVMMASKSSSSRCLLVSPVRRRRLSVPFSDCPAQHPYTVYITSHRERVHTRLVSAMRSLENDSAPLAAILGSLPADARVNNDICGLETGVEVLRALPSLDNWPSYRPERCWLVLMSSRAMRVGKALEVLVVTL
jgi:hypothetical protein